MIKLEVEEKMLSADWEEARRSGACLLCAGICHMTGDWTKENIQLIKIMQQVCHLETRILEVRSALGRWK